jgi:hypothetical protein
MIMARRAGIHLNRCGRIDDRADAMVFSIKNAVTKRRFDLKASRYDHIASFSSDRAVNRSRRSNGRVAFASVGGQLGARQGLAYHPIPMTGRRGCIR